jgi:hypothetical protein
MENGRFWPAPQFRGEQQQFLRQRQEITTLLLPTVLPSKYSFFHHFRLFNYFIYAYSLHSTAICKLFIANGHSAGAPRPESPSQYVLQPCFLRQSDPQSCFKTKPIFLAFAAVICPTVAKTMPDTIVVRYHHCEI